MSEINEIETVIAEREAVEPKGYAPVTIERSKKPKKIAPEKKKEYDKRYRGKLAQEIATQSVKKYLESSEELRNKTLEFPTPKNPEQELPGIVELPQQLRPPINRKEELNDLNEYVKKNKYKKLKESLKDIVKEFDEIKNTIQHPIKKGFTPAVYKCLFPRNNI